MAKSCKSQKGEEGWEPRCAVGAQGALTSPPHGVRVPQGKGPLNSPAHQGVLEPDKDAWEGEREWTWRRVRSDAFGRGHGVFFKTTARGISQGGDRLSSRSSPSPDPTHPTRPQGERTADTDLRQGEGAQALV